MEAFAKFKCFRRGHGLMGDWGRAIGLIVLITAIFLPTSRRKPALFQQAAKTSNSTAKVPAIAENKIIKGDRDEILEECGVHHYWVCSDRRERNNGFGAL